MTMTTTPTPIDPVKGEPPVPTLMSSIFAQGTARRQWRTRTTASATMRTPPWLRSRSYTSATDPACVFSTGTTAASTSAFSSAAKTSENVRRGSSFS
jgi:hypothetical protein